MSRIYLLQRVSALVVSLATLIAVPTYAAPAGAQLGPVQTGGDLISGGTISYQLNVTVTSPGELVAKATLRAKGFKATFPVLSNSLAVGFASLSSDAISIPTNFHGLAVLQVKAKFGRGSLRGKSILVTINVPPRHPRFRNRPGTTWI